MKVSTGTVMNVKRGMTSLENLKVVPVNQTKELAKISTREKHVAKGGVLHLNATPSPAHCPSI